MKRPVEELSGALLWLRSDLRLHDNKALTEAVAYAQAHSSALAAVYIFCLDELREMGVGPVRVNFVLRNLNQLQKDLACIGISLSVHIVKDYNGYGTVLSNVCHEQALGAVFFNKEFDPVAINRDKQVIEALSADGIGYQSFHDQCIVQEGFVLTKALKPYAMFTPFKNCWLQYLRDNPLELLAVPEFKAAIKVAGPKIPAAVPGFELSLEGVVNEFPAGEAVAVKKFGDFLEEKGRSYKETRNFPAQLGTTKISPYLAIGAISPRMAFEMARKLNHGHLSSGSEGLQTLMAELCWRDFYRHIMHHFPQVAAGQSFKPEAGRIEWREGPEAEKDYAAWCKGETGFPIVDAAMRQLAQTGWMHNRLRMIVSMFLTKDLLISWKRGEAWFSHHLIDYDFPSNNGGWQWSSSTGTDSQPYFRIFNPFTQSENFDKDGAFIRKFVPELAKVPAPAIHNPGASVSKADRVKLCPAYPEPIVDHAAARLRALDVFKRAFKKI